MSIRTRKWIIVLAVVAFMLGVPMVAYHFLPEQEDSFFTLYKDNCAICHGENLEGGPQGPALVGVELSHGDTVADIRAAIANGYPSLGMPAWSGVLRGNQLSSLAILVSEKRLNFDMGDLIDAEAITLPVDTITSEQHDFRIEEFVANIDPYPFSIAPMPDGGFLLTEKTRGISIISPEGRQSALIEGVPAAYDDGLKLGILEVGIGWLLDIALHPDYANNGWVYLHYTDRCVNNCDYTNRSMFLPVSMNKLERARIRNGQWVDVQTIWSAAPDTYSSAPDIGAGGRLAFDDQGHVFISVGFKGGSIYEGIQDLSLPYGKIHRVNDDGSIPPDNPFVVELGTTGANLADQTTDALPSIWTYGHRSPQGLEFNLLTGDLWGSEMGPRGGDEVNLLLPGRNYGWPLTSKGVDYDGTAVEYGSNLGIEFDLNDIEQPVVDFSPSPAISSFVFYRGSVFVNWQDNIIIGSLKAGELYRLVIEDNQLVHRETLIKGLGRIRDIEVGYDGLIYLLLENRAGGKIVRLVPDPNV